MSRNDDREDKQEKVDWRELDRRRDRSQHRSSSASSSRSAQESALRTPAAVERYKKQLDGLFQGVKKPSAEATAQLKKIRAARGREINAACLEYIQKFGAPPNEWDGLLLFLDASDAEILRATLEVCAKLYGEQPPSRQSNFKQQLRILAMTTSSPNLKKQIDELSKALS